MTAGKAMYPTLEGYYADDERRLRSEECDYGIHWRLQGREYRWRVSHVRNTGEIYAVHQGSAIRPVLVLAIIPPEPVADGDRRSLFHATLEAILDGWPERCCRPDSLRWVKDRLANIDMTLMTDWSQAVPEDAHPARPCLGCDSVMEAATEDTRRHRVRPAYPRCERQGWRAGAHHERRGGRPHGLAGGPRRR